MRTTGFGLIKQIAQPSAALQEPVSAVATTSVANVKPACPPSATPGAAPAQFRPGPAAAGEFLRMAGVAALSGLVFSLVTGLLVFLVANSSNLDAGPSQEASTISARH
jgi:hypothetical protein